VLACRLSRRTRTPAKEGRGRQRDCSVDPAHNQGAKAHATASADGGDRDTLAARGPRGPCAFCSVGCTSTSSGSRCGRAGRHACLSRLAVPKTTHRPRAQAARHRVGASRKVEVERGGRTSRRPLDIVVNATKKNAEVDVSDDLTGSCGWPRLGDHDGLDLRDDRTPKQSWPSVRRARQCVSRGNLSLGQATMRTRRPRRAHGHPTA